MASLDFSNDTPLSTRIVCAIVIFNTRLTHSSTYKTLILPNSDKIDRLLVFDNSQESQYEEIPFKHGDYHYYWDKSNPGVSTHYNKAAQYAQENGYQWLLLLDQDTIFPINAISCYQKAMTEFPHERLFVPKHKISNGRYLSPANACKKLKKHVDTGIVPIDKYDIINSGMLINVYDFIAVGGYKEDVNLDFSDFQFIERLRKRVDKLVILNMECTQDFSNEEQDEQKIIKRYKLFCKNACNFETESLKHKTKIIYFTLKHTLALCMRFKSLVYFKILSHSIFHKS